VNSFAYYGQDTWQATKKLSLNYGLRFDYEGPVHTGQPNLSVFDPSMASGLAVVGQDVANLYSKFWGGYSPRVGFSYQLGNSSKSVLRGGYGLYYDSIYMKSILEDANLQTGADFGPELNPAGSSQVAQASALNTVIQNGVPLYETYQQALAGAGITSISTFDKNFRPAYTQSFDLNLEQAFGSSMVWQLGYVGTKGTHLLGISDINQGALNSANISGSALQSSRPYFNQFPNFGSIYEEKTNLGSIYSSLQTSLRLQSWHRLAGSVAYTWGHAIDYETGSLPYLPQSSLNEAAERGNSDFDVRNTVTGYLDYNVPAFLGQNRFSKGWELNSGFSFHGGTPYTVTSESNPSGNGEGADRAVQVIAEPNHVPHGVGAVVPGVVQWFSSSAGGEAPAFVDAAPGTYSLTRRGQNYNPGYGSVDLAVIKNTPIHDRISAQFRADMINIFDRTNLAPLGWPATSEVGEIGSTIGPFLGNPGIGPGEPFNVQFSLKILF
jgi:hypothetical protein